MRSGCTCLSPCKAKHWVSMDPSPQRLEPLAPESFLDYCQIGSSPPRAWRLAFLQRARKKIYVYIYIYFFPQNRTMSSFAHYRKVTLKRGCLFYPWLHLPGLPVHKHSRQELLESKGAFSTFEKNLLYLVKPRFKLQVCFNHSSCMLALCRIFP